ncbi:FtsB family cell division protein [Candidatus Sordicultor fermentans]|jgi:cell division protein DivIC|uniref:FtsB family cell division protein n=1 Tax=Candidatus Sordicultor fermentans TaxID=1953203 RepID=UPI0016B7F63F|nr:septum formation initiator family protein [Atribacterota bacterium]MDI9608357.1 septum formation initiator family protein [Atribacterota bacterium]NLY04951.1 septum formation initiator family protein [Candidatus Atribacteria bacterium]
MPLFSEEKRFSKFPVTEKGWEKFLFIAFLALSLFSFNLRLSNKLVDYFDLAREMKELEKRESALSEEVERLEKEREYLDEDWYVEKLARERLQLVKPGEIVVKVINPESPEH